MFMSKQSHKCSFLLLFFIEQKQNGILVLNFGQTNFSPLQIWCRVWTHLVEQLTTNKSDDSPRLHENLLIGFKGQGLPCQNIKIENMSFVFEMSPMFHVPTHRGLSYKLNALLLLKIRVVGRHKVPTLAPGQHVYTHTHNTRERYHWKQILLLMK